MPKKVYELPKASVAAAGDDFLTREELAARLKITPSSVTRLVSEEGMPCVYVGRKLGGRGSRPRYSWEVVCRWFAAYRTVKPH